MKRYYPLWLLIPAASSIVIANTLNIGANIYGMAGTLNLLLPIPVAALSVLISAVILVMVIKLRYRQIERVFKWSALALFAYIIASLLARPDWLLLLKSAVIPVLHWNREFLLIIFAVLGTTISPYLFFWQASEEAEEVKQDHPRFRVCKFRPVGKGTLGAIEWDTRIGMIFSNLISFFIIALAGTAIYHAGARDIGTLREAAEMLKPLAGEYAYILFAVGLVGAGLLGIPVLAGSAAYTMAELFGWKGSLDAPFSRARAFYIVLTAAILLGLFIPFVGITPVQALFWTANLNGAVAPLLIALIVHMAQNPNIVGPHRSTTPVHYLGVVGLFLMLTSGLYLVFS
jgi:Mn2+/Fe2+ NRAMP family transporter